MCYSFCFRRVIWLYRYPELALFRHMTHTPSFFFFFFNDTATTEIYTLSLHDALPIWRCSGSACSTRPRNSSPSPAAPARAVPSLTAWPRSSPPTALPWSAPSRDGPRSEEHTSELQSLTNLVCRLLLEKKKKKKYDEKD